MNATLPTDSTARKETPIVSGCLDYFPAALAGVARISYAGNQKHNPGEPLHHARGKSTDHADCIVRHLIDLQGLLAFFSRPLADGTPPPPTDCEAVLAEASALAWRALALSQELHERFGAPLAPGARLPAPVFVQPLLTEAERAALLAEGPGPMVPFADPFPAGLRAIVDSIQNPPAVEYDGEPRAVELGGEVEQIDAPITPAPLRIEAGKRYRRRDGEISGAIELRDGYVGLWRFTSTTTGHSYDEAGFYYGPDELSRLDLIEEYAGP